VELPCRDIFTSALGGKYFPSWDKSTTPPHSKWFVLIFNVFKCKFAIHACLHPPKHLTIPPQIQTPRKKTAPMWGSFGDFPFFGQKPLNQYWSHWPPYHENKGKPTPLVIWNEFWKTFAPKEQRLKCKRRKKKKHKKNYLQSYILLNCLES